MKTSLVLTALAAVAGTILIQATPLPAIEIKSAQVQADRLTNVLGAGGLIATGVLSSRGESGEVVNAVAHAGSKSSSIDDTAHELVDSVLPSVASPKHSLDHNGASGSGVGHADGLAGSLSSPGSPVKATGSDEGTSSDVDPEHPFGKPGMFINDWLQHPKPTKATWEAGWRTYPQNLQYLHPDNDPWVYITELKGQYRLFHELSDSRDEYLIKHHPDVKTAQKNEFSATDAWYRASRRFKLHRWIRGEHLSTFEKAVHESKTTLGEVLEKARQTTSHLPPPREPISPPSWPQVPPIDGKPQPMHPQGLYLTIPNHPPPHKAFFRPGQAEPHSSSSQAASRAQSRP